MPNTSSALAPALKLIAAATLCAASVSVWAQSPEYRRGYDDGFRAGQQSQQQPGGYPQGGYPQGGFPPSGFDRGNRGPRIEILDARYGRGNRACDARGSVQAIVDQQGGAPFEVNNNLCGDPAPNQPKALDVTYRCGGSGPVRVSASETQGMRIACR